MAFSRSAEGDFVGGEKRRERFTAEEFVFAFALDGQRIKADQHIIHDARVAHHDAGLRHPLKEFSHQGAEVGCLRKIIGAGKGRVES